MNRYAFVTRVERIINDVYEILCRYCAPDESLELAKKVADLWASRYIQDPLTGDYHRK